MLIPATNIARGTASCPIGFPGPPLREHRCVRSKSAVILLLGAAVPVLLSSFAAHVAAAVVNVPPVTISELTHDAWRVESYSLGGDSLDFAGDAVAFPIMDPVTSPGTGYTSSGFTAAIAPGDTVVVRFTAPPGKVFVVHREQDAPAVSFSVNAHWSAGGGVLSNYNPHTVTFENLAGTAPTETYGVTMVGDAGQYIYFHLDFDVTGEFEFTALRIEIVASHSFTAGEWTFDQVGSFAIPSWIAATHGTTDPERVVMEIRDLPGGEPLAPVTGEPVRLSALPPVPNPTTGPLTAEFVVARDAHVRLSVVDLQGREVAVLKDETLTPGLHRAAWNGRSGRGRVSAGVYFVRYAAADQSFMKRIVIVH